MPSVESFSNPATEALRQRILAAYAPEFLANAAEELGKSVANHFDRLARREGAVLPWIDPPEQVAAARERLYDAPLDPRNRPAVHARFRELTELVLSRVQNIHHPHYVGHQVCANVPLASLFDALGSLTNQGMAVYEMGPWGMASERALVEELGVRAGWNPGTFGGTVTHGGSIANLTALLTARNVLDPDCWKQGVTGEPVIVGQAEAHYCVGRSAGILGLGTDAFCKIPLDDHRRMDVAELRKKLTMLRAEGRPVIAVVASCCATPVGAFDPLHEIADICEEFNVWLHVDAAHGGAALFSDRHRHLLQGLERADSFVCDAHKMLFVPALCAFVMYRKKKNRFVAFQQNAPYLFDSRHAGWEEYDGGLMTLECTKRSAAFSLWGLWSLFGPQFFGDLVDLLFETAQQFHRLLSASPDFRPLHIPECNIQMFRYQPAAWNDLAPDELGRRQLQLRREMMESGSFYLSPSSLDGVGALRATIINPMTAEADLRLLLETIRHTARQLWSGE